MRTAVSTENLQGYLNLFVLGTNPPVEMLEKVELGIKLAFQNLKLLRFRDFCASNADVSDDFINTVL